MKALLTRGRALTMSFIWVMVCALVACGGGGGGGSSSSGGGGGSNSTVVLTGVVATGAPLLGATVSVIDSRGVSQGSATTNLADGTYELTLSGTASPTLPLLVKAAGVDMSGTPVLLYSVVQSTAAGANAKTLAHINPLTNAVLGLLLGGNPTVYAPTTSSSPKWTLLRNSTALAAASLFVKTAIRLNLTDARLTDLTRVDFFQDTTFIANKTGLDAAIEGVRIEFGQDLSANELMYVSNRLLVAGTREVTVNLTMAAGNLAGTTPTVAAAATTSTLKATTGNSTLMPYVATLEKLRADINAFMARHALASEFGTTQFISTSYIQFDGVEASDLTTTLAAYGNSGYQLNRFQILGCLDNPIVSKCKKIAVSALIRDAAGAVVGVFNNAVTYVTATGWTFIGNDRLTRWNIYPITWATWSAIGTPDTSLSTNSGRGIQAYISGTFTGAAILHLPVANFTMYGCGPTGATTFCLNAIESGDLITDQVLPLTNGGPIGPTDAQWGTVYELDTAPFGIPDPIPNLSVLTADLPPIAASSVYPLPDGIDASTPLTIGNLTSGLTITWNTWAAANPQLRMVEVRGVITSTATLPITKFVTVLPLTANTATLPVFATIPTDAVAYTLWLIAQDDQGRRYVSKIAATP